MTKPSYLNQIFFGVDRLTDYAIKWHTSCKIDSEISQEAILSVLFQQVSAVADRLGDALCHRECVANKVGRSV